MFFNQNTSSKLFLLYFVEKIEEAGASDVGGNIYSSLTLTFGCYGSPSFLKNKVKKESRLSLKGILDVLISQIDLYVYNNFE